MPQSRADEAFLREHSGLEYKPSDEQRSRTGAGNTIMWSLVLAPGALLGLGVGRGNVSRPVTLSHPASPAGEAEPTAPPEYRQTRKSTFHAGPQDLS